MSAGGTPQRGDIKVSDTPSENRGGVASPPLNDHRNTELNQFEKYVPHRVGYVFLRGNKSENQKISFPEKSGESENQFSVDLQRK